MSDNQLSDIELPEIVGGPESPGRTFAITGLSLPSWFTKEHAKRVFQNDIFHENMQNVLGAFAKPLGLTVRFNWCECCGLSSAGVYPGEATEIGIDGHSWREDGNTRFYCSNIDTTAQVVVLYAAWAKYLNVIRLLKEAQ